MCELVYTAVHKLGSRDNDVQEKLRAIELAICRKYGVAVADVYGQTDLETKLNEAKAEAAKVDVYTENSIAKLNKVIQDAEAVFHDENAKQDQVNAQISALEEAMEALVLLIDEAKENLAALIAQAEAAVQQSEIYTEESLQALQSALDAAKMIYENPSASVDDVKGQCIALQKALDSLVEW